MASTIERHCEQCAVDFIALMKEVNRGKGRFCSAKCANKYRSLHRENKGGFGWVSYAGITLSEEYRKAQRKSHDIVERLNLAKEPCETCGSIPTHAHHDDYREPLSIRWLCVSHHRKWHSDNGPALF